MSINELIAITGTERLSPGQSAVVDPIAVGIAAKHHINIAVLDGRDIDLVESALDGKEFHGTIVRSWLLGGRKENQRECVKGHQQNVEWEVAES